MLLKFYAKNFHGNIFLCIGIRALHLNHYHPLGDNSGVSGILGWQPLWQVLLLHTPWKIVALLTPGKTHPRTLLSYPLGPPLFGFSYINFISSLGNHRPDKRYPGRMFQFLFCFIYFFLFRRSFRFYRSFELLKVAGQLCLCLE